MMRLAAVGVIAWGVNQACTAHAALQEARKVSEYMKQSSKELAEFQTQVHQLQQELDRYSEILSGMDAKLKKGSKERFWALAELNLLVAEKIPSLLGRIQDVAQNMWEKGQRLNNDLDDAERREANARCEQKGNTTAAIGAGVGASGAGLSFLAPLCPPILAFTIPLALGGTGAAVGTGIAADCHDGKTKKLTQEQIQSIKDQISKLEELKQKCQNLHAQGTDLLQSVLQKLLLPPSSKL